MSDKPPSLPRHISANGAEIWSWADAFSKAMHRAVKVRELSADIAKVRCGDCDKWMKSRLCPREHNVNGQTRGPSCEGLPCGQFVETPTARDRRQAKRDELAALQAEMQS